MRTALAFTLTAALTACGPAAHVEPAPETDAGTPVADAGPVVADAGPACVVPADHFGTQVGRKFMPLSLEQCGPSAAFDFYGADYCAADVTLLMINTGWCHPSAVAADLLGPEIVETYGPRVRVLEVLTQDESFRAADEPFCARWTDAHHLTNVELLDPTGLTQIYSPADMIPATILVDREGTIRFRSYGLTTDHTTGALTMADIMTGIDDVLAHPHFTGR